MPNCNETYQDHEASAVLNAVVVLFSVAALSFAIGLAVGHSVPNRITELEPITITVE